MRGNPKNRNTINNWFCLPLATNSPFYRVKKFSQQLYHAEFAKNSAAVTLSDGVREASAQLVRSLLKTASPFATLFAANSVHLLSTNPPDRHFRAVSRYIRQPKTRKRLDRNHEQTAVCRRNTSTRRSVHGEFTPTPAP